jgi:hypothetical protein
MLARHWSAGCDNHVVIALTGTGALIKPNALKTKSGLCRQKHVIHKQASMPDFRNVTIASVGAQNDRFAVVERRIDDERYAGFRKGKRYELVKEEI